jgi:hypothetical protein
MVLICFYSIEENLINRQTGWTFNCFVYSRLWGILVFRGLDRGFGLYVFRSLPQQNGDILIQDTRLSTITG